MKGLVTCLVICSLGGIAGAVTGWQQVRKLQVQNADLRAQLAQVQNEASSASAELEAQHQSAIKKLEADAKEVHRLRGEVGQLRTGVKAMQQLQEANRRLTSENQALRSNVSEAMAAAAEAQEDELASGQAFPKDSWEFMGYTTPEDALISAIWSMQQGDPQTYFDSLAPAEQERMAERWQDMTEDEVSEKHQSDVASISGLQVLNRRQVSDSEVMMDVYIEGPDRMETVSMERLGGDWKFKGYIRNEGQ